MFVYIYIYIYIYIYTVYNKKTTPNVMIFTVEFLCCCTVKRRSEGLLEVTSFEHFSLNHESFQSEVSFRDRQGRTGHREHRENARCPTFILILLLLFFFYIVVVVVFVACRMY